MGARVLGNATGASVASVKLRAGVSIVAPRATPTPVIPAAQIAYVLLGADAFLDTTGRFRYIPETVVTVDGVSLHPVKGFADQVAYDDTYTLDIGKAASDYATVDDVLVATLVFLRDLDDFANVPDAVLYTLAKAVVDAVATTDVARFDFTGAYADASVVTEFAARNVIKALADQASVTELLAASYEKLLADAQTFADEAVRDTLKSLADATGVADSRFFDSTKALADGVGMNDNLGAGDGSLLSFAAAYANVAFVADSVVFAQYREAVDTVTMTDGGVVSITDYTEPGYFLEDYVGITRSF